MKVTVTGSGLKAVTREHGLTEYWSHRLTYCAAPAAFPRIFCWVYRHEGRRLKQELRCHAVLCPKEAVARRMASQLRARLAQALSEFKRDKVCRQNARLSLANSVYENPSMPRRKILLSTGSHNYRPPLERSKSAPKLMVIEESLEEEQEEQEAEQTRRDLARIAEEDGERLRDIMAMLEEEEEDGDEGSSSLQSLSSSGSGSSSSSGGAILLRHYTSLPQLCPLQEVDWRPAAAPDDLEQLAAALRRSATFPPPTGSPAPVAPGGAKLGSEAGVELDSLSEEDEDQEEAAPKDEDNVSDESGYAEIIVDKDDFQGQSPSSCVRV